MVNARRFATLIECHLTLSIGIPRKAIFLKMCATGLKHYMTHNVATRADLRLKFGGKGYVRIHIFF